MAMSQYPHLWHWVKEEVQCCVIGDYYETLSQIMQLSLYGCFTVFSPCYAFIKLKLGSHVNIIAFLLGPRWDQGSPKCSWVREILHSRLAAIFMISLPSIFCIGLFISCPILTENCSVMRVLSRSHSRVRSENSFSRGNLESFSVRVPRDASYPRRDPTWPAPPLRIVIKLQSYFGSQSDKTCDNELPGILHNICSPIHIDRL